MKKFLLPSLLVIITVAFIYYIPSIRKGIQVNRLETLKQEYARCELVIQDTHIKANKIRNELGLIVES